MKGAVRNDWVYFEGRAMRFLDRLDLLCERKRAVKDDCKAFSLSTWREDIPISGAGEGCDEEYSWVGKGIRILNMVSLRCLLGIQEEVRSGQFGYVNLDFRRENCRYKCGSHWDPDGI